MIVTKVFFLLLPIFSRLPNLDRPIPSSTSPILSRLRLLDLCKSHLVSCKSQCAEFFTVLSFSRDSSSSQKSGEIPVFSLRSNSKAEDRARERERGCANSGVKFESSQRQNSQPACLPVLCRAVERDRAGSEVVVTISNCGLSYYHPFFTLSPQKNSSRLVSLAAGSTHSSRDGDSKCTINNPNSSISMNAIDSIPS